MAVDDFSSLCAKLGVALKPVQAKFGVTVEGLDLRKPLSDEQQALLLAAMDRHAALLFRGQALTPADEERAVRYFPHDAEVKSYVVLSSGGGRLSSPRDRSVLR